MYNPQLDTFLKVADTGSFARAAEELYISPTAVIKQINLLEADLGLRLFCRTHRGISLTEAGESLYQDAKYLMSYARDSLVRAQNAMQNKENLIRIGTSLMTPSRFLVDLWPKIHALCPNLKFQMVSFENTPENAREILKSLGQNIDLVAGIYDESFLNSRGCAALELSREPLCCAVSFHHPLAQRETLTPQDLLGENLMMVSRGWNSHMDRLREGLAEKYPQIRIQDFPFHSVDVFNQCESRGSVLISIESWKNIHPLLKIIPVQWDYHIPFGILHALQPAPRVQNFLDAVIKVF